MNSYFKAAAFLLVAAAGLHAQSTFGTIVGTVKDPSGAAIPSTRIAVRNIDENTTRVVNSDDQGLFEVPNLKPGLYEVVASKPGFASSRVAQAPLEARQTVRADLKLDVASVQQEVLVQGAITAVNTENATISDSKSFDQITQLPVNYRGATTSPLGAILVVPGVEQDSNGNISIGGGLPAQADYSLDGVTTVNIRSHTPQPDMYPSSEMLSEFKVTVANNNAEFGQMGDVTVTSKGGGNRIHGSGFWYAQNAVLDATTYGSTLKPAKVYNTFGGSFSGPVFIPKVYSGRNRTFFFVDYEGNRHPGSGLQQFSTPTASMRSGNLAGLPGGVSTDPLSGLPFPGNAVPASRINSVASSFLTNFYAPPNFTSAGTAANLRRLALTNSNTDGTDFRIDHVISARHQVYGRYSWKERPYLSPTLLGVDSFAVRSRNLILADSFSVSAHAFNEFRFGISLLTTADKFSIDGRTAVSTLGLKGLDLTHIPDNTGGFPAIDFSDGTGFSSVGHPRDGAQQSNSFIFTDNLSWIKGRHSMKFGVDIRFMSYQDIAHYGAADDFSAFTFNAGTFSGNAFTDFLLGLPTTSNIAIMGPNLDEFVRHNAFYAQDEWRVSDRVTVNVGLRYQVTPPMREAYGDITNFDPTTGNVIIPDKSLAPSPGFLAGNNGCPGTVASLPCTHVVTASSAGVPQGLRFTDYSNIDPRVSVAWRPFGGNKTVIRSGFGTFTETLLGPSAYPFTGVHTADIRTYTNFTGKGKPPLFTFPDTSAGSFLLTPVGTEDFIALMDLHFKDPRAYQWNFTVEREVAWQTLLRVTYLGSHSVGLTTPADINQVHASAAPYSAANKPFPQWARLRDWNNIGFASFEGLQGEVSHRYANGLFFQGSYMFSKNLGNAGGPIGGPSGVSLPAEANGGLSVTDRFNTGLDRGNVAGTRTHRFLLTAQYQLPFGRGRRMLGHMNGVANAIFGGWNLSTITLIQTGPWLTPTISAASDRSNTNATGRTLQTRPDRIGNGNLSDPTPDHYFDINAFTAAPVGSARFGNAGVGILEGPGTIAVSGGLAKVFAIHERLKLRLEASFRNLPNHPNFNPPAVNTSAPATFGKLLAVQAQENSGNRSGQVAARFDF